MSDQDAVGNEDIPEQDGPIGKPSQAEGDDVDETPAEEGPIGKPSQAEGDD